MKTLCLAGMLAASAAAQTLIEPPVLVRLIRRPGVDAAAIRRYTGAAVHVFGMTCALLTRDRSTCLIAPDATEYSGQRPTSEVAYRGAV